MNVNEKMALNVSETAAVLGVSRPVVYQLMKRSDFPAFKVGKRTLIARSGLEEWVKNQVSAESDKNLRCN